jgi:hypothetical protein
VAATRLRQRIWLDKQLFLVAADIEPEKVEALVEVDNSRLPDRSWEKQEGTHQIGGLNCEPFGGRYRTRTCDLSRVKAFQAHFTSWRFATNQPLNRIFS